MKRREFIIAVAGFASLLSPAARAQNQVRKIGVLSNLSADDLEGKERNSAFVQALKDLGWVEGRNLQIDYRWSSGDSDRLRADARELAAQVPDLFFATSGVSILPLQQANANIPIIFAQTIDPVGQGVVESLSRPGGNATGFTQLEFGITGKWLELLKRINPQLKRVAVLRDAFDPAGIGQWGALQLGASAVAVELSLINVRDPGAIERGIAKISQVENSAMIVSASAPAAVHRSRITQLAEQHRVLAIYPYAYFGRVGGLIAYGPETIDQYRRAAGYVARIFKGEKPADLPVQAPTRYNLVVNLRAAKTIGVSIPADLLASADEVIE